MAETRCKYYKQKRQVSYDGGATWQDVIPYQYQKGALYEHESADCGALVVYRWVNMDASVDYYCEGTTKYYKQKKQVSYDGGQTWIDVSPAEYQRGGVAEQRSTDCGYVPPTPQYRWIKSDDTICVESPEPPTGKKFVATYYNGTTREVECNSSTELTSGETRPSGFDYRKMSNAVIGQCVTTIGEEAFDFYSGLTSVTIPNSVTTIGNSAFRECTSLTSISIPNSVTSVGEMTFEDCNGLTSVTMSNSITGISAETFWRCHSLKRFNSNVDGECNIPNSVTSIGDGALYHCDGFTSINIPSGVTSIGGSAFMYCISLTSINIPSGITSISSGVFSECKSFTSITIPNNVASIGDSAFAGCNGLTSIDIPSGVTNIERWAFYNCTGLTSVTVNAITPPTLGREVFDATNNCPIYVPCQSLNSYKTATNWNTYASRIQGIPPCGETSKKLVATYPDSRTLEVECNDSTELASGETHSSFYNDSKMTSAVIGQCVTSIGGYAFYHCTILTSVTIPNSVTSIGASAFVGCSGLTSVTIPSGVTTIGRDAFAYCDNLTSIDIPSGVTSIGDGVFTHCTGLTSVTIPSGVTTIGRDAFWNCYSLQSINIPNNVTTIGDSAFQECISFTNITIPNSVTVIDTYAFYGCSGLTSVTVEAIDPPQLGSNAFNQTGNAPIYVPSQSVNAYKSAWSQYASRIQVIP